MIQVASDNCYSAYINIIGSGDLMMDKNNTNVSVLVDEYINK